MLPAIVSSLQNSARVAARAQKARKVVNRDEMKFPVPIRTLNDDCESILGDIHSVTFNGIERKVLDAGCLLAESTTTTAKASSVPADVMTLLRHFSDEVGISKFIRDVAHHRGVLPNGEIVGGGWESRCYHRDSTDLSNPPNDGSSTHFSPDVLQNIDKVRSLSAKMKNGDHLGGRKNVLASIVYVDRNPSSALLEGLESAINSAFSTSSSLGALKFVRLPEDIDALIALKSMNPSRTVVILNIRSNESKGADAEDLALAADVLKWLLQNESKEKNCQVIMRQQVFLFFDGCAQGSSRYQELFPVLPNVGKAKDGSEFGVTIDSRNIFPIHPAPRLSGISYPETTATLSAGFVIMFRHGFQMWRDVLEGGKMVDDSVIVGWGGGEMTIPVLTDFWEYILSSFSPSPKSTGSPVRSSTSSVVSDLGRQLAIDEHCGIIGKFLRQKWEECIKKKGGNNEVDVIIDKLKNSLHVGSDDEGGEEILCELRNELSRVCRERDEDNVYPLPPLRPVEEGTQFILSKSAVTFPPKKSQSRGKTKGKGDNLSPATLNLLKYKA